MHRIYENKTWKVINRFSWGFVIQCQENKNDVRRISEKGWQALPLKGDLSGNKTTNN